MTEPTITCPHCKTSIRLTESLAAPLIEATRTRYEHKLSEKEAEVAKREASIHAQQEQVAEAKRSIDDQVASKLVSEREKIAVEEARKAKLVLGNEIDEKAKEVLNLQAVLEQREAKLAEAQQAQADIIRKSRELDDAKREIGLTIEKRVQDSLSAVHLKAKNDAEAGFQLKVREKEEQIAGMQRQIEELKRKAEQGSQQLQGEVQELELESILKSKFPRDTIEPVGKGEFGGDLVHRVFTQTGHLAGTILWETKRTKTWSDGWLPKLRSDQRAAKADVALIISHAMPKEVKAAFDLIDGVWVAEPKCAVPVAVALRESLIALSGARQAREGQHTKMEMVYQYLTGPRFRHRVEAIVEKFTDMQADLDRERKAMTKLWARREEQIRGVVESTAGMWGDLQGIAGKSLVEIEGLELALIEASPDPMEYPGPQS